MAWEKFKYAEQETVLPAKILLIDELASFLDNQPREKMRLVDEFQDHMQNITRLGRAAHVHLIAATQSCTSSLFPPSLKNNIAFRTICGRVEANISRMAIDSDAGESIAKVPGSYLGYLSGDLQMYQGYWTPKDVALNLGTFKEGYELFTDEDGEVHLEIPEVEDDDDDEFEEELIEDSTEDESIFEFTKEDLEVDEETTEVESTDEDDDLEDLHAFLAQRNNNNNNKESNKNINEIEEKTDSKKVSLNIKKKPEQKKINLNNKLNINSTQKEKKTTKISYIE